jgi:hypothetical protein
LFVANVSQNSATHTFVKDDECQLVHLDKGVAEGIMKDLVRRDDYLGVQEEGVPDMFS